MCLVAPIIYFAIAFTIGPASLTAKLVLGTFATLGFYLLEFTQNYPKLNISGSQLLFLLIAPFCILTVTWLLLVPHTQHERNNVLWITLGASVVAYLIEFVLVPLIKLPNKN